LKSIDFLENPQTFFLFLFYKEKMFTIEIEDGRKAPLKPCYGTGNSRVLIVLVEI